MWWNKFSLQSRLTAEMSALGLKCWQVSGLLACGQTCWNIATLAEMMTLGLKWNVTVSTLAEVLTLGLGLKCRCHYCGWNVDTWSEMSLSVLWLKCSHLVWNVTVSTLAEMGFAVMQQVTLSMNLFYGVTSVTLSYLLKKVLCPKAGSVHLSLHFSLCWAFSLRWPYIFHFSLFIIHSSVCWRGLLLGLLLDVTTVAVVENTLTVVRKVNLIPYIQVVEALKSQLMVFLVCR